MEMILYSTTDPLAGAIARSVRVNLATDSARRRWPADVLERVHGKTGIVVAVLTEGPEVQFMRVKFDAPVCFFDGGQVRAEHDFRPEDLAELPQ